MFQSHIPSHFWSYAIKHVVYLINRVPSPITGNKTPFELLFKQPPNFMMPRVFGCLCYASSHVAHCHKFAPRSRRGAFLGFQSGIKGYVILDLGTKEIFISRDVLFHDTLFPFLHENQPKDTTFSQPIGPNTNTR